MPRGNLLVDIAEGFVQSSEGFAAELENMTLYCRTDTGSPLSQLGEEWAASDTAWPVQQDWPCLEPGEYMLAEA